MPKTPPMNLPPEATPWGRAMQQRIENLERSAQRRVQAEANANQGQNGTLTSLAKQIVTLNETVAQLVFPASSQVTVDNFALTNVFSEVAAASIPVPEGYTRAQVTAYGTVSGMVESVTVADYLRAFITIDGVSGSSPFDLLIPNYTIGTVPVAASRTISDVGDAISVTVSGRFDTGTGGDTAFSRAILVTQVLFLK